MLDVATISARVKVVLRPYSAIIVKSVAVNVYFSNKAPPVSIALHCVGSMEVKTTLGSHVADLGKPSIKIGACIINNTLFKFFNW